MRMHFPKLSAILFASIAVADQHGVQHFHHRRQLNSTSSGISTTLTVYQTLVHTITSCAPTITNCPARSSAGAGVITDIVVLTTTICPVAAAESIASSIISAAGGSSSAFTGTSASSAISTPLGTGLANTGGQGTVGGSGGYNISETVLTYTLSSESSTTVITTTLKHTVTATEYFTQYFTRHQSTPAIQTGEIATPTGAAGTQAEEETPQDQPTTTITSSTTSTKYITVMLAPSISGLPTDVIAAPSSAGGSVIGVGGSTGTGICECATVAPVTVTVAMATVTVTYSPMGDSPTATPSSPATPIEIISEAIASSPIAPPTTAADVADLATASSSSLHPGTTAPVISPPAIIANGTAPFGNGTITTTKCYGSGTGFLTLAKPSQTMPIKY